MDCQDVFEKFPERFNPEAAGTWEAAIQFNISGEKGGDFVVKVADGTCEVIKGTVENPTATVVTSDETYLGIVRGTVNPMMALTLRKVKVKGSMGDVMKLNDAKIFRR